jgi:addiction module RelE/StbE family toxin
MRRVVFGKGFYKTAKSLPGAEQKKLAKLLHTLKQSPFHPQLHTKKLVGQMKGYFSFRITRDWRVIFEIKKPNTIHVIVVKQRKDSYR